MRYFLITAAIATAILLSAAGILIALPCTTHQLYAVNLTENKAEFRVRLGQEMVWSDTLQPRQRISAPVVTAISGASWNVQIETKRAEPKTYSIKNAYYMVGHPHETDIYVLVLTPKGAEIFPMEHPLIAAGTSKCWKEASRLALVFLNMLSCADEPKVSSRLERFNTNSSIFAAPGTAISSAGFMGAHRQSER